MARKKLKNRLTTKTRRKTRGKISTKSSARERVQKIKQTLLAARSKLAEVNKTWKAKYKSLQQTFKRQLKSAQLIAAQKAIAKFVKQEHTKIAQRSKAIEAALTRFETKALKKVSKKFKIGATVKAGKRRGRKTTSVVKTTKATRKTGRGRPAKLKVVSTISKTKASRRGRPRKMAA